MSGLHLSLQETLKNKSVVRCTKGKKPGSQRTSRKQIYLRISDQIASTSDRRKKTQRLNLDFYEKKSPPMLVQSMLKRPHILGTLGLAPTELVDLRFLKNLVGFWTCTWWRTTKTGARAQEWRHRSVECRKDERWLTGGETTNQDQASA